MGIQSDNLTAAAGSSQTADPLVERFGQLDILDDVIRHRAADIIQCPILAYPSSKSNLSSYDYYTGRELDLMIDRTVMSLIADGFEPVGRDPKTVAILSPSDFKMVITFFALSRLGYAVMMLSPRLSTEACGSLLQKVKCHTVLHGETPAIRATIENILNETGVSCRPIMKAFVTSPTINATHIRHRVRISLPRSNDIALILHSSGSTGHPKPMFLSHMALMSHPPRGPGLTSFNPLPWCHLHGISTALQAMWMRKTAYLWNAALPLDELSLISALEKARPQLVAAVPYMLQLVVSNPRGINALRQCKLVTYGGAPCPDELGDFLVREGVQFGGSFGCTEAGLVADSISRPEEDPYWDYLKFFDNIRSNIWMKPIGNSFYECVYLSGHPALTTSNSNDPPGSFHSKDVFTPHPTIPHRWKFVSRLDDRITLTNGEKVLPLAIEGHIKQYPLIHEAVVIGLGRSAPGLLIFRHGGNPASSISDDDFLKEIWPTVEEANVRAERFSQISKDLITILPYDPCFPRTDKGSMIRGKVYSQYADVIERVYTLAENVCGNAFLDLDGTKSLLLRLCRENLGVVISLTTADFFSAGVDSLKAMQFRRLILQTFRLEAESFKQNVVYEMGNIARLADYICSVQNGFEISAVKDDTSFMRSLIKRYSDFGTHIPQESVSVSRSVILTGATGAVGAHTLYELLKDETIAKVYCFTRRSSPLEAVFQSLADKGLKITADQASRIIAFNSPLDQPNFGLDQRTIHEMRSNVTQIIHAAWAVNFNMPLGYFEPHIHGLQNLIRFSLSVRREEPATLIFCSSISVALCSQSREVDESPVELESGYMGYGRSKLVGEHIVSKANSEGARTYSLRIGQVSGHSKRGLWNDAEALPLMIRSSLTLRALPDIGGTCSWLPVDKLASTIVELTNLSSRASRNLVETGPSSASETHGMDNSIYNVCNPRQFSWSALLKALHSNGFQFEVVSFDEWLALLRKSEARREVHVNPAVKLIQHYESMHGRNNENSRLQPSEFITRKAERDSVTLRNGRLRIIEDGILDCYIRDWLRRWMTSH